MVPSQPRLDVGKLRDETVAKEFANRLSGHLGGLGAFGGPEELWNAFKTTVLDVAGGCLGTHRRAKKNFVSQGTLDTIDQSRRARLNGRAELFRELRHKTARALRVDKEAYVRGICEGVEHHLWTGDSRPFIRVKNDTCPAVLYDFVTKHWKLGEPNLVISVTGGIVDSQMNPTLKEVFKRGLIKVARNPGVWIITDGINCGVTKVVGEAVRDYEISRRSQQSQQSNVVTIGVATCGVLDKERDCARYDVDELHGHLPCLDSYHSHFILVDNGTTGQDGVEIELRVTVNPPILILDWKSLTGEAVIYSHHCLCLSSFSFQCLDKPMHTALVNNRYQFVQLFLDHGLVLKELFINKRHLEELYQNHPNPDLLLKIMPAKTQEASASRNDCDQSVVIRQILEDLRDNQSHSNDGEGLEVNPFLIKMRNRAMELLMQPLDKWGGSTCLELAYNAVAKDFFAHCGVQNLLTQIWCGEMSDTVLVEVCALRCTVPVFLCSAGFIGCLSKAGISHSGSHGPNCFVVSVVRRKTAPRDYGCAKSWIHFWNAPITIFLTNLASELIFLYIYASVILTDMHPWPTGPGLLEIFLYTWLVAFITEELKQVCLGSLKGGIVVPQPIFWNKLDVLTSVLIVVGTACRYVVIFLNFVILCVRLLHIFTISKILGPKIIIVKKMVEDLVFFLFLLTLSMFAYGVSTQSLLIHNDKRVHFVLRGIFYRPYLILFGEVSDSIHGTYTNSTQNKSWQGSAISDCSFPCLFLHSFTFQMVHDNNDKVWKYQRYELVHEYISKSAWPPPINIISHVFQLVKCCCRLKISRKLASYYRIKALCTSTDYLFPPPNSSRPTFALLP
uniref:TRPM SLOG domain-containing protein n=1 Tax=Eptatretus burgeri TaxID=7764 RepID=A0A8C4NCI5_EPTBU